VAETREILEELYQRIDEEHQKLLVDQLGHPDASLRAKALSSLCPYLSENQLWDLSEDPSHVVRRRLVACTYNRRLDTLLEKLARDPHPSVRTQAARRCEDPDLLRELAEDRSPRVRRATLLRVVTLDFDLGMKVVTELSKDPSFIVRTLAFELKKALSGAVFDSQLLPVSVLRRLTTVESRLFDQLSDLNSRLRAVTRCDEFGKVLSKIRPEKLRVHEIDELSKVLLRLLPTCKELIAEIPWLGELSKKCSGDALKRLLKVFHRLDADATLFLPHLFSENEEVQAVALEALGKRGDRNALAAAEKIVKENRGSDRIIRASLKVLKRFKVVDDFLAKRYTQIVLEKQFSRSTRKLAITLLKNGRVREATEDLLPLVSDPLEPPSIRKAVVRAIATLNPDLLFEV